MYIIEEFTGLRHTTIVKMSFELVYLGWCKFEKSKIFRCLTEHIEELQTKDSHRRKQAD